jgi:hypothetical protein
VLKFVLFPFRYYPKVFVVRPEELLHIPKGCLHAFRKMDNSVLPEDDCHYMLRKNVIKGVLGTINKFPSVFLSIAWDWHYTGVTLEGMHRELLASLETAAICQRYGTANLGIPAVCLIRLAQNVARPRKTVRHSVFSLIAPQATLSNFKKLSAELNEREICRAIYPALNYILNMDLAESSKYLSGRNNNTGSDFEVNHFADINHRPQSSKTDPFGLDGYQCEICKKELSNQYFHCLGCEKLLKKDYNICVKCHSQKKYQDENIGNELDTGRRHVATATLLAPKPCSCKRFPPKPRESMGVSAGVADDLPGEACSPAFRPCYECDGCMTCSCQCHSIFCLRYRFLNSEESAKLLKRIRGLLDNWKKEQDGGWVSNKVLDENQKYGSKRLERALMPLPWDCPDKSSQRGHLDMLATTVGRYGKEVEESL